jgi:hypothetical protein
MSALMNENTLVTIRGVFEQFSNFCRGQKLVLNARSDAWRIAVPGATFAVVRHVSGSILKAPEDD